MQHVLRCWERQSDGTEYKKTLSRPGLHPDPAEGAYSAPANHLVGGEGLAVPSPRTTPTLSVIRASPLLHPLQNYFQCRSLHPSPQTVTEMVMGVSWPLSRQYRIPRLFRVTSTWLYRLPVTLEIQIETQQCSINSTMFVNVLERTTHKQNVA